MHNVYPSNKKPGKNRQVSNRFTLTTVDIQEILKIGGTVLKIFKAVLQEEILKSFFLYYLLGKYFV